MYSRGAIPLRQGYGGTGKAVVVNGEGSGEYFRIVADYIHLNPVRIGWVGGRSRKTLRSWRWSSFPNYAGRKSPEWLVTDRVIEEFALAEGRRGLKAFAHYPEERAKDQEGVLTDESLKALRRGWYLGEAPKRKCTRRVGESARCSGGGAVGEGGVESASIAGRTENLVGRGKWLEEKSLLASLIRRRTGVRNAWIAERFAMGGESNATVALRRVRESKGLMRRLAKLEKDFGLK
jgi:hypothetical protein